MVIGMRRKPFARAVGPQIVCKDSSRIADSLELPSESMRIMGLQSF
jgi:hypothetical protein